MQNLSRYNDFYLYENKNQFDINGFVLSLAFKQRLGEPENGLYFVG